MYVIVYDTLMKIFENISRKKVSRSNLYFRERRKNLCVRYLWNLKTWEKWKNDISFHFIEGT